MLEETIDYVSCDEIHESQLVYLHIRLIYLSMWEISDVFFQFR